MRRENPLYPNLDPQYVEAAQTPRGKSTFFGWETGVLTMRNIERDAEILERRIRGESLWEIAQAIGVTYDTVRNVLRRHYDRNISGRMEELRDIQNEQIDRVIKGVWGKASTGSLPHIDRLVKLWERQAKLNGLDILPNVNVDQRTVNIVVGDLTPEQIAALASMRTSDEQKLLNPGGEDEASQDVEEEDDEKEAEEGDFEELD